MIIRQLCYSAAKNTALGWPGNNGNIFKSLVQLLAARHSGMRFVYVDSKGDDKAEREAYSFANNCRCILGRHTPFKSGKGCREQHLNDPTTAKRKVSTALDETFPVKPKPWITGEDAPDKDAGRSHRGRAKVHALQFALLSELLACDTPKIFWDFVRKRTDPRPKKSESYGN
jgi:hypothetical protein